MESWRRELYLMHYGVKGQRKGIRNGPPYPINRDNNLIPVSMNLVAKNGIKVNNISSHAQEEAKDRGVNTKQIVDALEKPIHIGEVITDSEGRSSQRFIGLDATVNVNPDTGNIATLWKTGSRTKRKYLK